MPEGNCVSVGYAPCKQPPPHIQYLSPYNKLLVLELKVAKLEIYAWFRSLGAAARNEDSHWEKMGTEWIAMILNKVFLTKSLVLKQARYVAHGNQR